MHRILAGLSVLAALVVFVAPARAAQARAEHAAASIATSALLALAPDPAVIAEATSSSPTASIYTITATATGPGTIDPSGALLVTPGSDRTFTMSATPCAAAHSILVDGVDQGPLTTYTFRNVSANHTIEAIYMPLPPDTIVASAGANGTISPAGSTVYDCGASATYTIAPDSCFLIGDVLVDGVSQGATPSFTFKNLQASHTIRATFVSGTKFTIASSVGPNGMVTPLGAVNVDCGSDQTFTIAPNSCFKIADVLVDGTSQGPVTSYTFTNVRAAHTLFASFASAGIPDTIIASGGPGGTIAPAGTIVVACGSSQKFSIRHDPCYRVDDVVVDGVSQGPESTFVFSDIVGSHTISASFASSPQYPITAIAGVGGSITPSGIVQVDCGANQTFVIAPDSVHSVVTVLVDGVQQDSVTSYTFMNVNDPHSIEVQFPTDYIFAAGPVQCSTGYTPRVRGGPFHPNTTYTFDVQPLPDCDAPTPGATLARAGTVQTNATGFIFTSSAPCYNRLPQTVILDLVGDGIYHPAVDPITCFEIGSATAATGVQDLEGAITPEGVTLSWWVMDLSRYSGFLVHRAPDGGDELLVTPAPLAPPSSHPPAQVRWRDGSAAPGTRYSYRIEALKSVGSDWYGPVTLSVPAAPKQLALRGATPNPFSGATRLALDVPADESELRLEVYDVAGRHVRTLRPGTMSPGQEVVDWDGLDDHGAPARGGLYLVRLRGASGTSVMRVLKRD